jgi:hypothetical protein
MQRVGFREREVKRFFGWFSEGKGDATVLVRVKWLVLAMLDREEAACAWLWSRREVAAHLTLPARRGAPVGVGTKNVPAPPQVSACRRAASNKKQGDEGQVLTKGWTPVLGGR